jgi:hypothetical protein
MASARSHVKPILLARTTTLVAKLLSAVFLVSLAIISRLEARPGQWFTPERRIEILSSLAIVGLAFQAYAIAAEHFAHRDARKKSLRVFCFFIHSLLAKGRTTGSSFRVTVFEPMRKVRNWWGLRLVSVARYVHGEGSEESSIDFAPEEGTVGMAFSSLEIVSKSDLPSHDEDAEGYLEAVSKSCNISKERIMDSKRHPRCFLSYPIIYSDYPGKAAAVLSVDSTGPEPFKEGTRKLEGAVQLLSSLYHKYGS